MKVPLRVYLDSQILALQNQFRARFEEYQRSAVREIAVTDARLNKMNEIREQLGEQYTQFNTQISRYVPRDEYNARHDSLVSEARRLDTLFRQYVSIDAHERLINDVRKLSDWQANMAGRIWAMGVGIIVLQVLVAVVLHVLRDRTIG